MMPLLRRLASAAVLSLLGILSFAQNTVILDDSLVVTVSSSLKMKVEETVRIMVLNKDGEDDAAVAEVAKIASKADASTVTELSGKVTKNTEDISAINGKLVGLTGAMHFVGTSTTDPMSEGRSTISPSAALPKTWRRSCSVRMRESCNVTLWTASLWRTAKTAA